MTAEAGNTSVLHGAREGGHQWAKVPSSFLGAERRMKLTTPGQSDEELVLGFRRRARSELAGLEGRIKGPKPGIHGRQATA